MHPCSIALWPLAAAALAAAQPQDEARPLVLRAALEGEALLPGSERYLSRALDEAGERGAEALIIELDTPGGLLESTRTLVKSFLASDVPIVVYVAPEGSRAASAGTFLTLAAHVAAMAPGTTIGAAHPVFLGGLPVEPEEPPGAEPGQQDEGGAMMDKLVNDTASWARSIAELRGRNADWAEETVRESLSVGAEEALEAGAIDLIAADTAALLAAIDGREVELLGGARVLRTANARVEDVEMAAVERLLYLISLPQVAYLLIMIGFYGIVHELSSPGFGVPGVLGVLCLLLGLFGLSMLPYSWLGLGLLLLGLGLLVAEAFVASFGLLGLAGAACLVLGGLMLVDSPAGFLRVPIAVVAPVAAATSIVVVFLATSAVRARRRPAIGGSEGLLLEPARALGAFCGESSAFAGHVLVHGERWRARSAVPVAAGTKCAVRGREGLVLFVEPGPRVSETV